MGLTKQYLRYTAGPIFNIVASVNSRIKFVTIRGTHGNFCAVGAAENVVVWDLKRTEPYLTLKGEYAEAVTLAASPDKKHLAVGYQDGAVRIFSLLTGEMTVVFSGHRSCVTALAYDDSGMRLVSGSNDTDVIIWNVVDESGLYRLKGHKGVVTQVAFLKQRKVLVTSSKDTTIKFWDLDTQHCFKTLTGHATEIWDFTLNQKENRLFTGSGDNTIRVWKLSYLDNDNEDDEVVSVVPTSKKAKVETSSDEESDDDETDDSNSFLTCELYGTLAKKGKGRVSTLTLDATDSLLACHGTDSHLELFKLNSEQETTKHLQRRQKKARKRQRENDGVEIPELGIDDEISRLETQTLSAKLRSVDVLMVHGVAKIACLLNNNTISGLSLPVEATLSDKLTTQTVSLPGHRSDIRTLAFSSDNTTVLSASCESVKIWNRATQHCIRTMNCGYALSSLFAPGDRHLLIGTKSGKIQIFDIAAGSLLVELDAHAGPVWSMDTAPDQRGIVSGGADKKVRFWNYELLEVDGIPGRSLSLVARKVLQMSDDVLCVKYSPNHKLLAVSLLDYTVKVFFADTLKFFLTLYGHKLPVLCLDISSDSSLIVTGSADRNVKIWGLDFGDCHKSIYAHDDSIMGVKFVPKTHMFFTVGKDGLVKEWDGDKFNHIQTLRGHHSEVWTLTVSPSGNLVVTAAHDRTLRLWTKSTEPLILEEEEENAREKEDEKAMLEGEETVVPGETQGEVMMAGKKTVESLKSTERLMEALDIHKEEGEKMKAHEAECEAKGKSLPPPALHPHLIAYNASTPDDYFHTILKKVRSSELEEALLSLPFSYVSHLLTILGGLLKRGLSVELICRCLFFLLRVHKGQITSSAELLPVVEQLQSVTMEKVTEARDTVGFNIAGLRFLEKQIEDKNEVTFFTDATRALKEKRRKAKAKVILAVKT